MRWKASLQIATKNGTSILRRDFIRAGSLTTVVSVLCPRWALAATVASFDYYISPTGSDGNSGSSSSPWALTALNSKRSTYAGKRVGVLPGTYNCIGLLGGVYTGSFDSPAFLIAGGTAGSPTVIQSTTPQAAILNGGATSSNNPSGQPLIGTIGSTAGAGYITIDGFEIKNCYGRAVSIGSDTGAPLTGSRLSGMVIQNCYIHDLSNNLSGGNPTGITVYSSQGSLISNNYITNLYDNFGRASGIEIWTSINTITQYNTVISTSTQQSGGILHKNASQHDNTVCFNYIDMTRSGTNGGYGVIMDSDGGASTRDSVYNNVIIGNNAVQPSAIDTGNYPASSNNQMWYSNTFVGTPDFSVGGWIRFGAPSTIKFFNNIVRRGTTGGRGDVDSSASAFALIDYNCYPSTPSLGLSTNGTTDYPSTLQSSLSSWASSLPAGTIGKDAHSLTTDPQFAATGTEANYYRLRAGSPCIGKGSKDGTSSGTATDMGAWGNGATQVGCNFQRGASGPAAPALTVS